MSAAPSGQQHEITAGAYRAVVTEVGATLRTLTHDGRDLVRGFDEAELRPYYRGAVLAPWPNRIGDGRYTFQGAEQQLPLTEPERACAMHGLAVWLPWQLLERTASSVALGARIWAQTGYPHQLDLRAECSLGEDGLTWTLEALNSGSTPAPYGTAVHPYLVAGAGRVDDWTLELDAAQVLDVDPERLLPREVVDVGDLDLDLRGGRSLSGVEVDHAFTGLGGAAGPWGRSATVRAQDGAGVRILWDADLGWVQVHTADRPDPAAEPEAHRAGLALEPMTCPPDAFRTGTDLLVLAPGERHRARWRIEAVAP